MIKRVLNKMNRLNGSINSIEGNIACGKSTILDHLKSKNEKSIYCMQEPVSEWTNMKSGTDVLKLFYEEKERWAFSFENLVQLSRLKSHYECNRIINQHAQMLENTNKNEQSMNVFMERSILSSFNVFTLNTFEEKGLNKVEFDILNRYFMLFKNQLDTNVNYEENVENIVYRIIYIRTSPEVSFSRLKMRNRESEKTIDLNYLTKIHTKYENWINNLIKQKGTLVKIIDGNLDKKQVIAQIDHLLESEKKQAIS